MEGSWCVHLSFVLVWLFAWHAKLLPAAWFLCWQIIFLWYRPILACNTHGCGAHSPMVCGTSWFHLADAVNIWHFVFLWFTYFAFRYLVLDVPSTSSKGVTAPSGILYKAKLQLNLVHKLNKMEQKSKTGDFAVFAGHLQCSLLSFTLG